MLVSTGRARRSGRPECWNTRDGYIARCLLRPSAREMKLRSGSPSCLICLTLQQRETECTQSAGKASMVLVLLGF